MNDEYVPLSKTELIAKIQADPKFQRYWNSNDTLVRVATTLTRVRKQKKLTQGKLAKLAGVKQTSISRAESGSVMPSLYFLDRLAKAMGLKLNVQFE